MEEEYIQRLFQRRNRLFDWLDYLGKMIFEARAGTFSFEPREIKQIEGMIESSIQSLKSIEQRLDFNRVVGIQDFRFHEIVRIGLPEFLPDKYWDYQVWIGSVPKQGRMVYVLQLRKERAPKLPEMEIRQYVDQVSDYADAWRMLGTIADDYKELIYKEKNRYMGR